MDSSTIRSRKTSGTGMSTASGAAWCVVVMLDDD